MKKLDIPKIEPINVKQYEFKQSQYPQADKLPFRSIIVSASQGGKGKGILIQNLILKIYRGCFERIYIVSPTAHIDEAYKEVIKYIEKELKIDNKKEQYLFDEYNAEALQHIIDTQHKVIEYQKKMKMTKLFSCLLIIDDFAEDKTFMRYSKILHGLYTKSRHFGLSVITASQKLNALALALAFLPLALSCKSQNWASANGEAMPCYLKPKNRGPPGYLDDQVPR